MCVVVVSFVMMSDLGMAQDSVSGDGLEVVRGGLDGDQAEAAGGASIVGFVLLILIIVGVPTAASLGFRYLLKNNFLTYVATYVFVIACYGVARMTVEAIPSGDLPMTALVLLTTSMFGSFLAQVIYLLRLPKKKLG